MEPQRFLRMEIISTNFELGQPEVNLFASWLLNEPSAYYTWGNQIQTVWLQMHYNKSGPTSISMRSPICIDTQSDKKNNVIMFLLLYWLHQLGRVRHGTQSYFGCQWKS